MSAIGFARGAAAASVPDEKMGEINPVLPGNDFYQGLFNLLRRALPGQTEATGEAAEAEQVVVGALNCEKGDAAAAGLQSYYRPAGNDGSYASL